MFHEKLGKVKKSSFILMSKEMRQQNKKKWEFLSIILADDTLQMTAGTETRTISLDNMLKRQEDAKRAAMTAANKNPRNRI